MTNIAVAVEHLSKQYSIRHQQNGADGLRHSLELLMRNPIGWLRARRQARQAQQETFWALKDVSFEIKQGETVAIVGRNGAGKSTLLKILSRITHPTRGRVQLNGRVASLLEVGTGFHQELTGRENIFLNGAILGMSKAEIARKFDDIVAFSEIEKFLDTPVKRYSSGMYVRLAFAVAAHLEPEILIVDEVLAVGDAAFQKKCLGKMQEVAHGGRTVLFVSHNTAAVQALCSHAVYFHAGAVRGTGRVEPVLHQYLTESGSAGGQRFSAPVNMGPHLKLLAFDCTPNPVESGQPFHFSLTFWSSKSIMFTELSLLINAAHGMRVALIDLRTLGLPTRIPTGEYWHVHGTIESLPLIEGDYSVGITVNIGEFHENVFDLVGFSVSSRRQDTGYAPYPVVYRGLVNLDFNASAHLRSSDRPLVLAPK
jgi:lipopolysaccharide transport system ATP-binding protein